ncbi:MAG: aspartyl/glutamyl-tRNA amidotransferase subunit C [Chloroflexota bacterium]|jgi:aspartyl/glutamyl-tRNA(Asn/Gln) amidotransferase C subunit
MADEITQDVFRHLVGLAALELNLEQEEYLRHELNNQLKAIHELAVIPIDESTPITLHGITYTPDVLSPDRQDEWVPYQNPEEIIAQAPESEEGYILVPDIPHEELE